MSFVSELLLWKQGMGVAALTSLSLLKNKGATSLFCRLHNVTWLLFLEAASAVVVMAEVVGMSTSCLQCRDAHGYVVDGTTTD